MFAPRTVVVALAAGIVVTLVAALSPARKAAKVSPIAAMSSETVGSVGYGSVARIVVGGVLLAAGLAVALTGLFADVPPRGAARRPRLPRRLPRRVRVRPDHLAAR